MFDLAISFPNFRLLKVFMLSILYS